MATATRDQLLYDLAYVSEKYPSTHYTLDDTSWYYLARIGFGYDFYFKVDTWPSSLKHNKLIGAQAVFCLNRQFNYLGIEIGLLASSYDASTVTYYTRPQKDGWMIDANVDTPVSGDRFIPGALYGTIFEAEDAFDFLNGKGFYLDAKVECQIKAVLENGDSPFVRITYDDTIKIISKIAYQSGPASGYYNPRDPATFRWDYVKESPDVYCAQESWDQSSATFYWKASGDSSYTSIALTTEKSVTIQANTFQINDEISWYVSGTDEEGTTTQTPVYTFSTSAGAASATPISPIDSIEDGSAPILMQWQLSSTDGLEPSRVEGQWRNDSEDPWTALFDLSPATEFYEAPANTFLAGQTAWRVRAYNIDGVAGEWAEASFISVAAPVPVAGLAATNVPRTTVTWQSAGQEAYEISIDGKIVRKAFGDAVRAWQATEPLADGTHEISVRVQGVYGLWSQPATVTIAIENVPETTISLSADFGTDANMSATLGQGATADRFQWYRDGVRIGETSAPAFSDRFVLGNHNYYVEIWHASGNYSRSETVNGTMSVAGKIIARFSGGGWLDITLTDSSSDAQTFNHSRTVTTQHITGSKYPRLERSIFRDLSGSYSCAFPTQQEAEALAALEGEVVIVKSNRGKVVIGCLQQLQERQTLFYAAFSFTVQQIEWEDFVTDENG